MVDLNRQNKENTSHSPRALGDDDEHKVMTDDEYRQGGKSKPKIITGKLPSAFSNPQIKYKNKQNEQYIKQIKDSVRIEDSYKNIQNSLEPLPMTIERQNKIKRSLKNGGEKHKSEIFKGFTNSNDPIKKSDNSFKYDQMAKSQSNGFGGFSNNMGSDVQINALEPSNINLQHMVSLALIKSNGMSGPIKKMLHVPTFTIYCVKEIPISSRDARSELKRRIIEWEQALSIGKGTQYLTNIHGTHWNTPEG